MDEDDLQREFGNTNLLVIGSPAVNLAARVINNHSIFRFNLAPEVREWEEQLRSLQGINDQDVLQGFWRMAQEPDTFDTTQLFSDATEEQAKQMEKLKQGFLSRKSAKDIMSSFKKPGFIDPADERIHAKFTRQDNDFAIISLGRNPFSTTDDYICIFVAGIHGPGTAHAIRALGEDDFVDHPFGGIIEVHLNLFKDWPTRFEQARWNWQTSKYTPQALLYNLENVLQRPIENWTEPFTNLSTTEVEGCLKFVQSMLTTPHE